MLLSTYQYGSDRMFQFRRGLSQEFVEQLNAEYKPGSWWQAIADDPQLCIAIRDERLNVYWKGCSLLELYMQGEALAGKVHYKYLLRPDANTNPYLQVVGGQFHLANPADFFFSDFSNIRGLKRAADVYAGEEKAGVHRIVMSNPNIIDVEVAFGTENELSGARVAQRIDFAALRKGNGGPELTFYEAKIFTNPELRANGKAAPVLGQLERYRQFVHDYQADLAASYRTVCGNLMSLHGVRNRFSEMHGVLSAISDGACDFKISDNVHLVVFGYDRDQDKGAVWRGHREKLEHLLAELNCSLLLKGDAKDFTNGISWSAR